MLDLSAVFATVNQPFSKLSASLEPYGATAQDFTVSSFIFEPLFSWGQELVFLCFGIPSERLFYLQSPMGSYLAFAIYMPVTLKVAKSLLRAPDSVSSRMLICISHKTNFLILVVFSQQKAAFPSGCPDIGSGMPPLGAIIQTNILEASLSA